MKNLEFNSQLTYFLGARHKFGDYAITKEGTDEVIKSGKTNKWRLFFMAPVNLQESNVTEGFGMTSTYYDVKGDELHLLFGKTEKEFKLDDFKRLVGQPVILDVANAPNSKGVQVASLRGVKSVADFMAAMTADK